MAVVATVRLEADADCDDVLGSRQPGRFDREFMMGATVPQLAAWVALAAIATALARAFG